MVRRVKAQQGGDIFDDEEEAEEDWISSETIDFSTFP